MGLFLGAAALSGVWLVVHLFMGGREIARPLRESDALAPVVRDTQYLCWHFTSASIAAIALFFLLAALRAEPTFAVAGTILSAAFTVIGVGLVKPLGQSFAVLPQGWLFLPITLLGLWGLWG